jgi:hypothetical protein
MAGEVDSSLIMLPEFGGKGERSEIEVLGDRSEVLGNRE